MKIATWNVNGIRKREAEFLDFLGTVKPDVVCLQETKASPDQLGDALLTLPGYYAFWHAAKKGYSGVALHLRASAFAAAPAFTHPPFDMESRLVATEIAGAANGASLVLASVYVPNGGKDFPAKMAFLESLVAWAGELRAEKKKLVLCGDFNITREERDVHPKERKPGIIGQRTDERALLERLIAEGLVDVGRALAPEDDNLFTWWAPWRQMKQRNIGWRLDYIFASEGLTPRSSVVMRETGTSDHGPVVADIETTAP